MDLASRETLLKGATDRDSQQPRAGRSLDPVSNSAQIREFLTSRRARVTPDQAGLPTYGENRRVSGLRREEVALLAGISIQYYTRLERGNARGVSESVPEAISRALRLDEAERTHLFDLVRAANAVAPQRRRNAQQRVRPGVQLLLDSISGAALLGNGRMDVLAANRLGRALYSPMFSGVERKANLGRFLFLDPDAPEFMQDWEEAADDAVAILRAEAGRDPTTGPCRTSSASCPPAATSSGFAGPLTTSKSTAAAPSGSTIRSLARSP